MAWKAVEVVLWVVVGAMGIRSAFGYFDLGVVRIGLFDERIGRWRCAREEERRDGLRQREIRKVSLTRGPPSFPTTAVASLLSKCNLRRSSGFLPTYGAQRHHVLTCNKCGLLGAFLNTPLPILSTSNSSRTILVSIHASEFL